MPDLKKILEKLSNLLARLQTVSGSQSVFEINSKFNIDEKLKTELETLGSLALRTSGAPSPLDNFKFHPQGVEKSLSITGLN